MKGRVLARTDAEYEATRRALVWNGLKPQRFPDFIVTPQDTDDVLAAVNFARENGLKIAVRSGGHHFSGTVVRDGGTVLDMSAFDHCEIDVQGRTARVGPALPKGDLVKQLNAVGLAFPAGHCASVTLGGYLLGGGIGWNTAQWGIACWSVLAVEAVTADGRLLTADANHHDELYWAARGAGGGFFGVVTGFTVALQTHPAVLRSSTLLVSAEHAAEVGAWMAQTVPTLRRSTELLSMVAAAPPPLAGVTRNVIVVAGCSFGDSDEDAGAGLSALDSFPLPVLHSELHKDETWDSLYAIIDRVLPAGAPIAAEALWLHGDPADLFDRAAAGLAAAPSPRSSMLAVVLPPLPEGVPFPDTAFSMVGPVALLVYSVWDDPASEAENRGWLADVAERFAPNLLGYYINECNLAVGPDHSQRAFAPPVWARLAALRAKHDPTGVFHSYLGSEAGRVAT
ncbi:FAD linked oxidase-like protein [Thioalkalivibrio nitratireducens DSM 14787]|uniref:FAD linked oxidase-like protein n=1 Tax=Thioalkalivibrio nitratireducens (strain DSM 14787 / UNIQEM 213 / ALEN2) TaxID=1255043 RepID=L0DWJ8_THIND|nr:FAD linked oxidase-like protein [Thioalkalivibrio nitratireducens DSM 14787]